MTNDRLGNPRARVPPVQGGSRTEQHFLQETVGKSRDEDGKSFRLAEFSQNLG